MKIGKYDAVEYRIKEVKHEPPKPLTGREKRNKKRKAERKKK